MAGRTVSRRIVIAGGAVAYSLGSASGRADQPADPERMKLPQPGDWLVSAGVDADTTPLKPGDLAAQDVTFAWSFDPHRKVPRDGSRLNMVLLMRFDPATLGEAEKLLAADGVAAFSAICTHQQCTVTDWLKSTQVLQCPCHQSQYDLRHGAKVVGGPAPRPLPALPLKLGNGVLVVAGPFSARVGGEQQQGA
ncbi:MAG TPA: Rieske (2Fe-2S) protein [Acetobacteraceae bacterium]|nr:Rieske (2Fe-2S) protein [Acetobacteraceae bacterium]